MSWGSGAASVGKSNSSSWRMPCAPLTALRVWVMAWRTASGVSRSMPRSTCEDATCWDSPGRPNWPTREPSREMTSAATATLSTAPPSRSSSPTPDFSSSPDSVRPSTVPRYSPSASSTSTVSSTAGICHCGSTYEATTGPAQNASTAPRTSPRMAARDRKNPRRYPATRYARSTTISSTSRRFRARVMKVLKGGGPRGELVRVGSSIRWVTGWTMNPGAVQWARDGNPTVP